MVKKILQDKDLLIKSGALLVMALAVLRIIDQDLSMGFTYIFAACLAVLHIPRLKASFNEHESVKKLFDITRYVLISLLVLANIIPFVINRII